MNSDDLEKLLAATHQRGNKQWDTPSGAIIDLLRDLIRQGKIDDVSAACCLYFLTYPEARAFVAGRLPGLIVNNHRPIGAIGFDEFIRWSSTTPQWSDEISSNAASGQLSVTIDTLVAKLTEFKSHKA